jgi:RNA polymerase sigma-70 factor (family 1)
MHDELLDIKSYLLHRTASGDTDAFARLFNLHRDKLYSFILGMSNSVQQAEDVVQDVFLKVWELRAELSTIDNFSAYLFRMSHNHCLNILKRKAREAAILSDIPTSSTSTYDPVLYRETEQQMREAIAELPAQQKLVFTLSRDVGLSQHEISQQLHITIPTVKSHMTQALRFLRARCKDVSPFIKSILFFF